MNTRRTWFGLALCSLIVVALACWLMATPAEAQKTRAEHRYDYKVVCFSYNPGESRPAGVRPAGVRPAGVTAGRGQAGRGQARLCAVKRC